MFLSNLGISNIRWLKMVLVFILKDFYMNVNKSKKGILWIF